MGQALDREGNVLGDARGATKQEVFDKLNEAHPTAHEIRVRSEMADAREVVPMGHGKEHDDKIEQALREAAGLCNFSVALEWLKQGRRVARSGWNGKGMWISLQRPDQNSKMTLPYIFMKTVNEELVPWLASQTDLLADDWQVV